MSVYVAAQWYNRRDRCGAIYLGAWSFHWTLDWTTEGVESRPRRCIIAYRNVLYEALRIPLWRHRGYCEHGYRTASAWWHRCDLVSAENPKGRPPEDDA